MYKKFYKASLTIRSTNLGGGWYESSPNMYKIIISYGDWMISDLLKTKEECKNRTRYLIEKLRRLYYKGKEDGSTRIRQQNQRVTGTEKDLPRSKEKIQ